MKGKYEYVITTHVDKGHIHNHIIFNATSFDDYHKYTTNKRNYYHLRNISDQICKEHGLSVIVPGADRGHHYKENMEYKRGTSWKAKLKVAIDKAIWASITYDEFLNRMKQTGYEIRQNKQLSFRAPGQKNFTYVRSLGINYEDERILERLAKNRNQLKTPRKITREVRLFIDISTYVSTGNRAGFEKWV